MKNVDKVMKNVDKVMKFVTNCSKWKSCKNDAKP